MRIVVHKPRGGRTRIVVTHKGVLLNFRRVLEGVDVTRVPESLGPVLEEWERRRDAIRDEASLQDG